MNPQNPELGSHVFHNVVEDLVVELCKDLDYSEIYNLAKVALIDKLSKEHGQRSLAYEYGERYDYVFLKHGVDPLG